ncbi:RNA polymerase sigma-70 factor [Planomonospora venezuelensis]|uniref:RNA polymerase sigma-70 factor (ECF subfamily) n=1 Tax=Planomonospora venezuelensis TaxID=1999 RepID=A0A841D952_PLAVE|nr:RNA polymerase sigma-70 factor (ECF subfamily) [Planomonospora venezuelensis]GIN00404.1 DNA-directed RNA polymerase sigma-70 factor [Planomonospora venezuelensis]
MIEEFEAHRVRMFGLAYRMLGSAAEAEDVVQDAYLRWSGTEPGGVAAPGAWLAKVVVNLCLNRLTSARATRESHVGAWLPEPVPTGELGPLETAEQRDSVSMAFLVLLERLTPAERAVFVLREAFAYGYREIAEVLDLSEAGCRQLHHRARRRVGERRRFDAPGGRRRLIVERFLEAARSGDLAGLEQVLAADVIAWADGGGKVSAALRPVLGRAKVIRYVAGIAAGAGEGLDVRHAEVNGQDAIVALYGGQAVMVLVVDVADGVVVGLRSVLDPGKLSRFGEPPGS